MTIADREAEAAMRDLIRAATRATASSARSTARSGPTPSYVWVLDPIDGTKSFITGRPLFGTLIALVASGGRCWA